LRHLGEADALAPEEVAPALGGLVEGIDVLGHGLDHTAMQIVGFGGFPQTSLLEHVFELAGGRRVLFDRTASPQIDFALDVDAEVTNLTFYPWPPDDLRALALSQHVILVGGGNTANMLAVWRLHGFDAILREAWEG